MNPETNIYCILSKLSSLKKEAGNRHFSYYVGNFMLQIWTYRQDQDDFGGPSDVVTGYDVVDINLHEADAIGVNLYESLIGSRDKDKHYNYIPLNRDVRFKDYAPIKYTDLFELSNGQKMPIMTLCELIKYLYRLSNLSAFS